MDFLASMLLWLSIILFVFGFILLIVNAIRKKKKAPALIMMLISVIMFFGSIFLVIKIAIDSAPSVPNNINNTVVESVPVYSDAEIFAAEFCMAYMNHLKNPYSFSIKSIQVYDDVDYGGYEVFVKFTAENSMGGTIADEIGTMGTLNKEQLKELASDSMYVDIYTWPSESAYIGMGRGEKLDAAKIQQYINENYD